MAVYPGATYRPLNQFSNAGTKPRVGFALHVNDSEGPSLYGWIAGNNGMSCHFQVAKSGAVEQYVDTDNGSWCQMAGNDTYLSIETEGHPAEPFTAEQIAAIAGILAWGQATHGIPLVAVDVVGQRGLICHGAGGAAWGGHTGCPGDIRKAQRADIIRIATTGDDDVTPDDINKIAAAVGPAVWAAQIHGVDATGKATTGNHPASVWLTNAGIAAAAAAASDPSGGAVDVAALSAKLADALGPQIAAELGNALVKGSAA